MSEWVRAGEAGAPQSSSAPRKARQRLPLVLHLDQTAFGTAEGHGHQAASEPTAASAKTSRCKVQSTPNCGTQGACALWVHDTKFRNLHTWRRAELQHRAAEPREPAARTRPSRTLACSYPLEWNRRFRHGRAQVRLQPERQRARLALFWSLFFTNPLPWERGRLFLSHAKLAPQRVWCSFYAPN